MSNPYGQQPGYPQQPGGWSQPGQPGGYPPQQQPGGWSQPGQPGSWSQPGQPGYPSSQPAGYPPQQPGGWPQQQGFAPAPQKKSGGLIILVVVLVVLVGGGAAGWFLFLSPSHPNSPLFDRHGVPANVPLPNGLTYDSQATASQSDQGITFTVTEWGWKVSGSDPLAVQKFYKDNLPGKGWTSVQTKTGDTGDQQVTACQGSDYLAIDTADKVDLSDSSGKTTSTVTAPAGGAALGIAIININNAQALALLCSGQSPGA